MVKWRDSCSEVVISPVSTSSNFISSNVDRNANVLEIISSNPNDVVFKEVQILAEQSSSLSQVEAPKGDGLDGILPFRVNAGVR